MMPFHNGHSAVLHSATTANVDTVIVDGRVLKFGGKILSVDVDDVRREATESSIFSVSAPAASGHRSPGKNAQPKLRDPACSCQTNSAEAASLSRTAKV